MLTVGCYVDGWLLRRRWVVMLTAAETVISLTNSALSDPTARLHHINDAQGLRKLPSKHFNT